MLRASCYGYIHASPLAPILDFPPTAHYLELLPPAYLFPPQVFNQPSPRLSLSTIHLSHNPLSFFIRESFWLLLLDDVPVSEAVLLFRSES